jgi:two-component system OmpR family response regulator
MHKQKILVIDDEPSITRLLKLNLELTGLYEVMEANNGAEAMTTAVSFRPQLMLMDIIMPDIDGGALAGQMLGDERLADVPIIFLTAAITRDEARDTSGFIGSYPFLAKPIQVEDLLRQIEKTLIEKAA